MTSRWVLVLALVAALTSLDAAASPASAAGPYTSFVVRSDPGDVAGTGTDHVYGPGDSIQMYGDAHLVHVGVDGWSIDIIGPGMDGPLIVGQTYTGVPAFGSGAGAQFSVRVAGGGYCGETTSSFTIRELTTDPAGDLTAFNVVFEQHCGASPAATRGSVAVGSSLPPVLLAPMLSADLQRDAVKYGDPVLLDLHLSADAPSHDVAVYLQPPGQAEVLLTTATAVGNGRTRVTLPATVSGVLTARWSGGGTFPDLAASDTVQVAAEVTAKLRGGKGPGREGRPHLVRASRSATIVARVQPDHEGDCLRFHIQYLVRGRWGYDGLVKCVRLDRHSAAGVRVRGDRRLVGIPIRLRAEWRGDELSTKTKGRWQYLRYVAG